MALSNAFDSQLEYLQTIIASFRENSSLDPILAQSLLSIARTTLEHVSAETYIFDVSEQIAHLLKNLMANRRVTRIEFLTRISPSGSNSEIGRFSERVNLALIAVENGISVRHLVLVESWLKFAMNSDLFDLAKSMCRGNIITKLTDTSETTINAAREFILFYGDNDNVTTIEYTYYPAIQQYSRLAVGPPNDLEYKGPRTFETFWRLPTGHIIQSL